MSYLLTGLICTSLILSGFASLSCSHLNGHDLSVTGYTIMNEWCQSIKLVTDMPVSLLTHVSACLPYMLDAVELNSVPIYPMDVEFCPCMKWRTLCFSILTSSRRHAHVYTNNINGCISSYEVEERGAGMERVKWKFRNIEQKRPCYCSNVVVYVALALVSWKFNGLIEGNLWP